MCALVMESGWWCRAGCGVQVGVYSQSKGQHASTALFRHRRTTGCASRRRGAGRGASYAHAAARCCAAAAPRTAQRCAGARNLRGAGGTPAGWPAHPSRPGLTVGHGPGRGRRWGCSSATGVWSGRRGWRQSRERADGRWPDLRCTGPAGPALTRAAAAGMREHCSAMRRGVVPLLLLARTSAPAASSA